MLNGMELKDAAGASIVRAKPRSIGRRLLAALLSPLEKAAGFFLRRTLIAAGMAAGFAIGGVYTVTCHDAAGNLKWTEIAHNQVKNGGLDHMLGVVFKAGTAVTTWYIGLITAGGTTTTAGDTMASHAGWTEFVNYSGTDRIAWDEGTPSGGVVTSTTTSDFTIDSGGGTVMGIFITSAQAQSPGNTGTLWSTADFATSQLVANSDVLKVTYTLTATSSS